MRGIDQAGQSETGRFNSPQWVSPTATWDLGGRGRSAFHLGFGFSISAISDRSPGSNFKPTSGPRYDRGALARPDLTILFQGLLRNES